MAFTSQKTVTAAASDGTIARAGLIDASVQALPQKEIIERATARYAPPDERVIAPNTDDQVNPGVEIEPWSEW